MGSKGEMVRFIGWIVGSLALVVLTGCADVSTWNQKMVVEVETPEGIVTGQSVVRVRFGSRSYLAFMDGSSVNWTPKGEAVVVDLGERGIMLALLKGEKGYMGDAGPNASFAFTSMYKFGAGEKEAIDGVMAWPEGKKVDLERRAYPLLVTFDDISDPTTIKQVDPENLAASFGPGVRLKSLTLEKTDETVSMGPLHDLFPGLTATTNRWVPGSEKLPYGHPMQHIPDSAFWAGKKL